ncbi:MAG: GGDEF domain-containing protein [Pseudomonas sp.]
MKPNRQPSPRGNHEISLTGLEESGRRSLMSLILGATGLTLGCFSILQFLADNYLFASFELLACSLLLWGSRGILHARRLELWIYLYLVPTFCFLIYIILMPKASATAFTWTYLMPLLSYLLLGKRRGALLTLPFICVAMLLYFVRYDLPLDAAGLIDIGNAILCGVLIIVFVHLYESRRAQAYQQLEYQAQTDPLTGVTSRGSFKRSLLRAIQEAERSHNPLVLVLMDIDHFKSVNDRWGHDAGDHALCHICEQLLDRLRVTDSLGRLGGEEFGLLLRNTDNASATRLVEQLRQHIVDNPLIYGGQPIALSATFGLAEWPTDGHSTDELYRCADRRLYSGKHQGRNCLINGADESPVQARAAAEATRQEP